MKERESRAYSGFERTLRSKEAQERKNKDISALPLKEQLAYWAKVEEEEKLAKLNRKSSEDSEPVRFGNIWRDEYLAAKQQIEAKKLKNRKDKDDDTDQTPSTGE